MELSLSPSEPPRPASRAHLAVVAPPIVGRREIDDETLLEAKAGDRSALGRFVRHYQGRVYAFVARSLGVDSQVDDVAQEVFLRAIRSLSTFTPDRAKVSTWLFQIAVRLLQDRHKRARRIVVPMSDDIHDGRIGPEEACDGRRNLKRLEALVMKLPEEQRVALILFEFHDQSHEEIAQATGTRVSTVKTRIFRARKFLKRELGLMEERKR